MTRFFLIVMSVTMLWGHNAVASPDAMTPDEARHLVSRTGFGAAPHEIEAMTGLSYRQGVTRLLADVRGEPVIAMPSWVDQWTYPHDQIWTLGQTQSELFNTNRWLELTELSSWWLAEMAATPSPLSERMVLFWSDHFANSFEAHENSQWMGRQNAFLRSHATGDFTTLASGMILDPAMLSYLDNVSNVVGAPNENLAREFLELFTLGEGRGYTQSDVQAAARVLTGYGISDMDGDVEFDPELHDGGIKVMFGERGRFDVDDLVRMTLNHPDFGPYIVEKLWQEFISDKPDPVEVQRLTALWISNDLELEPLLEAIFLSDAFWDPANRGRLVKSPVELIVGTTRTLGIGLPNAQDVVWMVAELDQGLFLPPNVGGWPKGVEWINDATASARATMLTYLMWGAQDFSVISPTPMMSGDFMSGDFFGLSLSPSVDANDLRVGQVFATYVEPRAEGEGLGGVFTLFDVGFRGQDWRSISIWFEYNEAEDFAALSLFNGDCGGTCLTSLPNDGDDDGWVVFAPWRGMLDDNPNISDDDIALMQALGTHFPALIATTSDHVPFGVNAYDPNHQAAEFEPFVTAAHRFAKASATEVGRHTGNLVLAFSSSESMGLAGGDMVQDVSDLDAYRQAREDATRRPFVADVMYETGRSWVDALNGTGPEARRAAKALLAVVQVTRPLEDTVVLSDPDTFLRQLILSPEYQVN